VRFFAHDPGASRQCALAGESIEHHRLKLALASSIREAGHHASVEAAGPEGLWRADVLSTSPDGATHWAWEAQLSAATNANIEERTARASSPTMDESFSDLPLAAGSCPDLPISAGQRMQPSDLRLALLVLQDPSVHCLSTTGAP
jgi:hypothetical protein